jgi:hypothetical protein
MCWPSDVPPGIRAERGRAPQRIAKDRTGRQREKKSGCDWGVRSTCRLLLLTTWTDNFENNMLKCFSFSQLLYQIWFGL